MALNHPPEDGSQASGTTATSRSLLARLRARDADAWHRLVDLYAPLIRHWCRKLDVPEQDITDVSQEVFKAVSTHIETFRKERAQDTFRGWLRTITHSKAIDQYRRGRHQPKAAGGTVALRRLTQLPAVDDASAEEEFEEARARHALFHRALEMIRRDFHEHTWNAFWRVVVDGRSPREVGEELSMRPGTVRVAKSRVLHRLRQELGELLD